jgi:hypothetical protein
LISHLCSQCTIPSVLIRYVVFRKKMHDTQAYHSVSSLYPILSTFGHTTDEKNDEWIPLIKLYTEVHE